MKIPGDHYRSPPMGTNRSPPMEVENHLPTATLKGDMSVAWSDLCDFTVEKRDFTTLLQASEEASKAVREELMAEVSWVSSTGENGIELYTCCVGKCGILPETNCSQLKIGRNPKGKDCLPTIHFQVRKC